MNDKRAPPDVPAYRLWQMVSYMLRLGTLSFGGPVALVGYMRRDLVEERGWIADADYKEGLALATAALLWRFQKLQEPVVIAAAAVLGLVLYPLMRA
jgi:chromate transport protein ChrA